MLRSLSSRLLIAFAFVIILSLALSAVGTLFLLRDQQQEAAEERVGRLAEPITLAVALLERAGVDEAAIHTAVSDYAQSFDVRVLLVRENGTVVFDSESALTGRSVDVFRAAGISVTRRGGAQFRMATYSSEGADLKLFAPARESLELSSNRLIQLQELIYGLDASSLTPEEINRLIEDVLAGPQTPVTIPLPELRPLVGVGEEELTSAWQDLLPQLLIVGAIALTASAAVAVLISRSISGRVGRVTQAAQAMARGNYDQRVDARGEDEVARLAQAFNVMAREVSGSQQMMRDLLANVSHELKTPLTSIQGFSQALEEGAITSPDEYRDAGRIINEETQRMRQLIDDLIELSRLESGQAVVQREPVDLEHVLRGCAKRFEWQAKESATEMHFDVPALPSVHGDERRLEQAFANLIDNAVRHTPQGGAVSIRAEAQNGLVRVAVHNTGSYIPPEELPRVFERFYQVARHRSRGTAGGGGLGLAIANEVVQAHRGSIAATSDRDGGTEFVVTLPLAQDAKGTKNGG